MSYRIFQTSIKRKFQDNGHLKIYGCRWIIQLRRNSLHVSDLRGQ